MFIKTRIVGVICLGLALGLCGAEKSPAQITFQISTVKPSASGTERHTRVSGNDFVSLGTTLSDLIKFAYGVTDSQFVGGPPWIRTEKFDTVVASGSDKRPSPTELREMVKEFLTVRFGLHVVPERQELPVFALKQTKKWLKLRVDDHSDGYLSGSLQPSGILYVHHATVADFATYLQRFAQAELGRPVVDQTEISGLYSFELHFSSLGRAGPSETGSVQAVNDYPDIFTAIEEQVGLRLTATRAPVEVLRIVSVSPPTPN